MPRDLHDDFIAELLADRNRPIFFFEGEFDSYTMRVHTGVGDIEWDGQTWLGNGWFREPDGIEESTDMSNNGMTATFVGVPVSLISTVLSDIKQNAPGKVWLGFLTEDGEVVANPYLLYDGKLDVPTIDDQVGGPVIQIDYASQFADFDRANEYRYTRESQKIFNPTDKGFDFVPSVQEWVGQWGAKKRAVKKKDERNTTKKKNKQSKK